MRRVVVTGMGIVSPLGVGIDRNWSRITNGASGIVRITHLDVSDMSSQIGGEVPFTNDPAPADGKFNIDLFVPPKEQKKMDIFIAYALAAAQEAVEDSGWMPMEEEDRFRTGVMIGSGIGGLHSMYESAITLHEKGPRRL
ncbi:MAG TPA: beta-ketoacyl synthase N-terminal-like domain-containing protein, partial [Micavibrio sp.]